MNVNCLYKNLTNAGKMEGAQSVAIDKLKKDGYLMVSSFLFLEGGLSRLSLKSYFFVVKHFLKTKIIRKILVK